MKRVGKNSVALGLVMLLISAAMSFSAQAAPEPVAQATSRAIQGTGLFEILDGGQCEAVEPDGTPTGRCGEGLDTTGVDAYSQTAKAGVDGKNGVSEAKASVAPIAIEDFTSLDLTDLLADLAAIDTGSVLDPVLGPLLGVLAPLLQPITDAVDGLLQPLLAGIESSLPLSIQIGAVESSAQIEKPDLVAEGSSTVAGINLVVDLGGQQIIVPITAGTEPNSNLLVGSPQDLVNGILDGLMATLDQSLGGALGALNALLLPLKDQILSAVFDALEPTLLQGLADALAPIVSGTVNVQTPVSPSSTGEIDVTALHLELLGPDNTLNLARVQVGPNGLDNTDVDAIADQDADANADAIADADVDSVADADVTTSLPNTGGSNVLPLILLALGLMGFGSAVLVNERRRLKLLV